MYTPVNPNFTIQKWGVRGYKSYGHVTLMIIINILRIIIVTGLHDLLTSLKNC